MSTTTDELVAGGALVVVVGTAWLAMGWDALQHLRQEHVARRRARNAETGAVEASMDDASFAPETIHAAVNDILRAAGSGATSPGSIEDRGDRDVIDIWARQHRLDAARRAVDHPRVDLLQIVNRDDEEDRVVLRVRGRIRRRRALRSLAHPEKMGFDERWTLRRSNAGWRLVEVDADPLAESVMHSSDIAGRWADQERLREASLIELAEQDAPLPAWSADLVDHDVDPERQLLDLSVIDGRFAPSLIEAMLAHLVDAWEQATLGAGHSIAQRAYPDARDQLQGRIVGQRPMKLVLRDARLKTWQPTSVITTDAHPRIEVALVVSAVGYLINDAQTRQIGSSNNARDLALRWTLTLTGHAEIPWQLTATTDPTTEIPGAQ